MYDIIESGKRIRQLRGKAGKSQVQMAEDLGVSVKTCQAIEQGHRGGSVDSLLLFADYFGVSLDFLIKGTEAAPDLDRLLSGLCEEKQTKVLRMMKAIIQTLEW